MSSSYTPPPTKLSPTEESELARHEQVIERGMKTFREVGAALGAIQRKRLYRATHATFEDYVTERWSVSRQHAYETIAAAKVAENLSAVADSPDTPQPTTERQCRPLVPLPPETQRAAWEDAVASFGPAPTAQQIKDSVVKVVNKVPASTNTPAPKAPSRAERKRADEKDARIDVGRVVVRLEVLAGRTTAEITDAIARACAILRDALDATGDWPWRGTKSKVYGDGRTPEDRLAERQRHEQRHPDARDRERARGRRRTERRRTKSRI